MAIIARGYKVIEILSESCRDSIIYYRYLLMTNQIAVLVTIMI